MINYSLDSGKKLKLKLILQAANAIRNFHATQ